VKSVNQENDGHEEEQIYRRTDHWHSEAASPNPFTSGWRPFIGWTCGAGFAVQFVVGPVGEWVCALAGHPIKFPQMDLGTMMPLLFGMLELGGVPDGREGEGGGSVTWARRSFLKWQRQCC